MDQGVDEKLAQEQRKREVDSAVRAKQNAQTTQALRNASNIAANSGNAYAMAAGNALKAADKISGGKSTEGLSNLLNKTASGRIAGKLASNALANNAAMAMAAKNGNGGSAVANASKNAAEVGKKAADASKKASEIGDKAKQAGNAAKENIGKGKDNLSDKNKSKKPDLNSGKTPDLDDDADLQEKKQFTMDVLMVTVGAPLIITALAVVGLVLPFIILYAAIESTVSDFQEKVDTIVPIAMRLAPAWYSFTTGDPTAFLISSVVDAAKTKKIVDQFGKNNYNYFMNVGNNKTISTEKGTCSGDECASRVEVQFYQKAMDIEYRYEELYGIKLDWPLIISTLIIRNEDKGQAFKDNLNDYNRNELKNTDMIMNIDWEYDYKNISGYNYLSNTDARYDMQILAKNMVKKTTTQTCKDANGKDLVDPLVLEDVEDELIDKDTDNGNYLECKNGTYNIESVYKLDKDKYDEFLDEYLENKYFIKDADKNYGGSNQSSGYTYDGNYGAAAERGNENFGWPLPENPAICISSPYGKRMHPIYHVEKFHNGIDLSAAGGTPVYAIADGTVIEAGYNSSMGNYVIINHTNGAQSIYMHASQLGVTKGQTVSRGDEIMKVGTTGASTGDHLHISIKINGAYVDPVTQIGSIRRCS